MERLRALVQTADLTGRPPRGSQSPFDCTLRSKCKSIRCLSSLLFLLVHETSLGMQLLGQKNRPTGWAGAVALTLWPSSQTTLKSEAEENGTDSSLFSHHLP